MPRRAGARWSGHGLHRILVRCADSPAPELHRLARTLQAQRGELLAHWTSTGRRGVSNGPTEATNCLIRGSSAAETASGTATTTDHGDGHGRYRVWLTVDQPSSRRAALFRVGR